MRRKMDDKIDVTIFTDSTYKVAETIFFAKKHRLEISIYNNNIENGYKNRVILRDLNLKFLIKDLRRLSMS